MGLVLKLNTMGVVSPPWGPPCMRLFIIQQYLFWPDSELSTGLCTQETTVDMVDSGPALKQKTITIRLSI